MDRDQSYQKEDGQSSASGNQIFEKPHIDSFQQSIFNYIDKYIPSLELIKDYISLGYLLGGVLLSAFMITWISTFFATQRFLNLQTDELYY